MFAHCYDARKCNSNDIFWMTKEDISGRIGMAKKQKMSGTKLIITFGGKNQMVTLQTVGITN